MRPLEKHEFNFVPKEAKADSEQTKPSLTYWADVWRRLKKNKMSMVGLVMVIIIVLTGVFGPMLSPYTYSQQYLSVRNAPPRLDIMQIDEDLYVYRTNDYYLALVTNDGHLLDENDQLLGVLELDRKDAINKTYYFIYNGEEVAMDFSYANDDSTPYDYAITYKGETYTKTETVHNADFWWGTDKLGRDVLTRVMSGARISLTIALVATLVNFFIGVTYGAISGYEGGRTDLVMMRIVDIINSIPQILNVIIIMVIFENRGLWLIVMVIGSVYWVGMARLVRGQILGLKEQEFVLAARTIGVSKRKIIFKHLIPNAIGPIIVALTMMIPSAVFTEAFLSFIGLGISAPLASWGTLANDAIAQMQKFPYQLFFPAGAIALTMLAFNFLGDGLRDALDPRLRKG